MPTEYIDHKGERHKVLTRATDTVTDKTVVVYKNSEGKILTRPLELFNGHIVVNGEKKKCFRAIT